MDDAFENMGGFSVSISSQWCCRNFHRIGCECNSGKCFSGLCT
jgi:hypothetical protein